MSYKLRSIGTALQIGGLVASSGSRANFSVNSAYVHRTSGAAIGIRYFCETNEPITEAYLCLDALTGTRANVTMQASVYNWSSTQTAQPSTTLLATSSVATMPASDDRWIRFVFPTPYTPAVDECVFIVFENLAVSPAVDFPGILTSNSASNDIVSPRMRGFSTVNGFSTAGTNISELSHLVVQGTSTLNGMPYTLLGSVATFNGRRGILLSEEVKKCEISFLRIGAVTGVYGNFEIFNLSEPPTGTPLYTKVLSAEEKSLGIFNLNLDLSTLPGSGPFVFCLSTTSTVSYSSLGQIEGYADYPSLFDIWSSDNFIHPPVVTQSGSSWVIDRSRNFGLEMSVSGIITPSGSTPQPFMRGTAF